MASWNYGASRPRPDEYDDLQVLADSRNRSPMRLLYGRLPSPPSISTSRPPREISPLPSHSGVSKASDYGNYPARSESSRRYTPPPTKDSSYSRSSASNDYPLVNPFAAPSYSWEEPRKDYYSGSYSPKPRDIPSPIPLSSDKNYRTSRSPKRFSPSRVSTQHPSQFSTLPLPTKTVENKWHPSRPNDSMSPTRRKYSVSPSRDSSSRRSRSPQWTSGDRRSKQRSPSQGKGSRGYSPKASERASLRRNSPNDSKRAEQRRYSPAVSDKDKGTKYSESSRERETRYSPIDKSYDQRQRSPQRDNQRGYSPKKEEQERYSPKREQRRNSPREKQRQYSPRREEKRRYSPTRDSSQKYRSPNRSERRSSPSQKPTTDREKSKRSRSPSQRVTPSHSITSERTSEQSWPSYQSSGNPVLASVHQAARISSVGFQRETILDPFKSLPLPVPKTAGTLRKSSLSPPPKKYLAGSEFKNVMASVQMVRRQREEIQGKSSTRDDFDLNPLPTTADLSSGPQAPTVAFDSYDFSKIDKTTPLHGTIKEYVSSRSGILEIKQIGSDILSEPAIVFFHTSIVWLQDKKDDPHGPPTKFIDMLFSGVSLKKDLPIGTKVFCRVKPVSYQYFELAALAVWPLVTSQPPIADYALETKVNFCVQEFVSAATIVQATLPKFPCSVDPYSEATIWEIKDDNFGLIEIKGRRKVKKVFSEDEFQDYRFFVLFHKDQVWLRDGQKPSDVAYFQDKPLAAFAEVGQKVTLSARSFVLTSGADLQPSVLELQAIAVVLNSDEFPETMPRPTRFINGSGAFLQGKEYTWYYLQHGLALHLNKLLVTYLELYNKTYPDIDPKCLSLDPMAFHESTTFQRRSLNTFSSQPLHVGAQTSPFKKTSKFDQSEPSQTPLEPIPVQLNVSVPYQEISRPQVERQSLLIHAEGQVVQHPNSECLILKSTRPEKPWTCLVPINKIIGKRFVSGKYVSYPISSLLLVNAVLVNEGKSVQFVATLAWSRAQMVLSRKDSEAQDRGVRLELLRFYRTFAGSNILHPLLKAQEGKVIKLLDDNFGVLETTNHSRVLFDTCDVWVEPGQTLDRTGDPLGKFCPEGSQVFCHGALIEKSAEIQYLATSVWLKKDARTFASSLKIQDPLPLEKISKAKIDIYNLVIKAVDLSSIKSSADSTNKLIESTFCSTGRVRCYPSNDCLVAENNEENWRCLVPVSVIKSKVSILGSLDITFPFDSAIQLNMLLVDDTRFVQYIATMAWSLKDESYLDKNGIISSSRSLDLPIPTDAFELYHKFSSEESNKMTPVHVNLVSKYNKNPGIVERYINDSCGVIVVSPHNHRVLFDVSDVYDVKQTLCMKYNKFRLLKFSERLSDKNLQDFMPVGKSVFFHAVMIEKNSVFPYLATGVWTGEANMLLTSHYYPQAIPKKELSPAKLYHYQTVVNSEHEVAQMAPIEVSGAFEPNQPSMTPAAPVQGPPPILSAFPPPVLPANPPVLAQSGLNPISTAPGGYYHPQQPSGNWPPYTQPQVTSTYIPPMHQPPSQAAHSNPYVQPIVPVQPSQPAQYSAPPMHYKADFVPSQVSDVTPKATSTVTGAQAHYSSGPKLIGELTKNPEIRNSMVTVNSVTLWLGSLSRIVEEGDLHELFSKYGTVKFINRLPSRGSAYIRMDTRSNADKALKNLSGYVLKGKEFLIRWAPGRGLKSDQFKSFWNLTTGDAKIPARSIQTLADVALLEDGAEIDEETLPDWLKSHRKLHKKQVPREFEPAPKPDSTTGDLPLRKTPLISFVPEKKKNIESDCVDVSGSTDTFSSLQVNERGTIRRLFKDVNWKPNNNIVGGLVHLTRTGKICFFMSKNCTKDFLVGDQVMVDIVSVQVPCSSLKLQMKVEFVALLVYPESDAESRRPTDSFAVKEAKYKEAKAKILEIAGLDTGALAVFKELYTMVDLNSKPIIQEPLVTQAPVVQSNRVIHDNINCIISTKCGVLECHRPEEENQKILCYFELEDLNIQGRGTMNLSNVSHSITIKDVVRLFSKNAGNVNISYIIKKVDCQIIPYVAENFKITGNLAPSLLSRLKLTPPKSYTPLTSERLKRFLDAVKLYQAKSFFAIDPILKVIETEVKQEANSSRTCADSLKDDIVVGTGIVKCVLDDNFGLLFGPDSAPSDDQRSFCLFDICDLYLSHQQTASDATKTVKDVAPVGTRVAFNACFIDGSKSVAYLATSVWLAENKDINVPLPSISRTTIQADKLEIYKQVADSCAPFVEAIRKKMHSEA